MIHQEFEAEPAPERQQSYLDFYFSETGGAVITEAAVVLPKITKRETVQVPAVRGIAERAEVGVMRRRDEQPAARCQYAMEFLHRADHIGDVLDHVNGAQLAEGAVAKRVRKTVQIAQHVGAGVGVAIDADGAGVLVDAAAYIENPGGS
jgi:hypothetical protein